MFKIAKIPVLVGVLGINIISGMACTIVILVDEKSVLFCNNEDWNLPNTRLWFVPGGSGKFGSVYVGFDTPYGQGGMNERGLAYDTVAGGSKEPLDRTPEMADPEGGYSCARMLETCSTVDEAVKYYTKTWEPGLERAKIVLADSSGSSAIIGVKDRKLHITKSKGTLCIGFGEATTRRMLANNASADPSNALNILHASRQGGEYGTKYSNVFDLISRKVYLPPVHNGGEPITMDLTVELSKGGHSYDMPARGPSSEK